MMMVMVFVVMAMVVMVDVAIVNDDGVCGYGNGGDVGCGDSE